MLISLSELLCSELSTKNYQRPRVKIPDEKIYITQDDTLGKNVTYIPIFPIKKKICYLYNMKENSF